MSDKNNMNEFTTVEVKRVQRENTEMSTNTVRGLQSLKAVLLAFLVGIILVCITGQTSELGSFLNGFYSENFGNITKFTDYLARLSYLVPLGLGVAVAFRIGIFNIGASGQAFGGGAVAFYLATKLKFGALGWLFCLAAGVATGLLIALLIAFLKNKFKVNEVISSIMFNWMIFYIVIHMSSEGVANPLPDNTLNMEWFSNLFSNDPFIPASASTNIGIIFIIPLVIVMAYAYKRTKWGYRQELIGNNANVGKYLGIDSKKEIYKAMMISGALAGLAGSVYFLGYTHSLPPAGATHEIPGWTFDGITIALLGFSSPIGVLGSSMVYALFTNDVDTIVGNLGIISIMVGVMLIFVAASNYRIQYGKRNGGAK